MKRGRNYGPTTAGNQLELMIEVLNIDREQAKQVFETLCAEGYIEPATASHPFFEAGQYQWFTTTQGNALANASARKPITRQTADRLIAQFLERVEQVNAGTYAYRVKQVIVFGSYVSDTPDLGDVDLSLILEDRYQDVPSRKIGHESRIAVAREAGRSFRDTMQMLMWPYQEVLLLLKGRSPSLSLHDEEGEQVLKKGIPSRLLFDADVSTSENNGSSQTHH